LVVGQRQRKKTRVNTGKQTSVDIRHFQRFMIILWQYRCAV